MPHTIPLAEARLARDTIRAEGITAAEYARRIGRPATTVRTWLQRLPEWEPDSTPTVEASATLEATGDSAVATSTGTVVRTLDALLAAAQVDLDHWHVVRHRVNVWGPEGGQSWQVRADLERIPVWVREPITVRDVPRVMSVSDTTPSQTALILPDVQFGFRWSTDRKVLDPLHDEAALALAVEIARRAQPDTIIQVGDLLDLAAFSTKYPRSPDLKYTTQPTLQAAHDWLAALREACPQAEMMVLEGNHEARIQNALIQLMDEAVGLKPVGSEHAAMSIPHLLALDALGVEYRPGYPESEAWLFDGQVYVTHGITVRRGGGATVAALVREATCSTVVGHIHRLELAARTLHGPEGARTIYAVSPGTLSRVDGVVPGSARPDWQQGVLLLHRLDGQVMPELVPIVAGRAMFRGEVLEAGCCG